MNETPLDEKSAWIAIFQNALRGGKLPTDWPEGGAEAREWRKMAEDLAEMREFALQLSFGSLSDTLGAKGQLAGSLKAVQASLRHLSWQVQQVAAGDLTQRIDFMGEFSAAFNRMTENLSQARAELRASEERYRKLVEASPDGILLTDLDGAITFVSPSTLGLFHAQEAGEINGRDILDWLPPDERPSYAETARKVLSGEASSARMTLFQRADGTTFPAEVYATAPRDEQGNASGLVLVIQDVSERRRREEQLHEQRALAEALRDSAAAINRAMNLEQVLDATLQNLGHVVPHDAVSILLLGADQVGRVARFSSYERLSPETEQSLLEREFTLANYSNLREMEASGKPLLIPDTRAFLWNFLEPMEWVRSYLGAPILLNEKPTGFLNLYSAEAGYFHEDHLARLAAFADQAAIGIQKARLFEELNRLATTDSLTGIPNRRHFFKQARIELSRRDRYGQDISSMMLDIDFFKEVNDTYGHAAGDQVLAGVAQVCHKTMRTVDLLARYGGEEFIFLLPETNLEQAQAAAERLRKAIEETRFETEAGAIAVTASIGVAGLNGEQPPNLDHLLIHADRALYEAKLRGRNQVKVYAP